MTIIRIHDKDGAALPELPPASIAILAVGIAVAAYAHIPAAPASI